MPKTLNNVKDDILSTTRKMLSESGYRKLNIREIASRCGIAAGTLYNYYKSKQEIVGEILETEWNMMQRRIDQRIRTQENLIDKLEIVYAELSVLMRDVHNIWFDSSVSNLEENEYSNAKSHRETLIKSLTTRIFSLIIDNKQDRDSEFLADVICRLFISYSYQENITFDKLSPIIISLLK